MRYRDLSDRGVAIGSGPALAKAGVEAANKILVTQRMKRSGMRWRIHGGQAVLTEPAPAKAGAPSSNPDASTAPGQASWAMPIPRPTTTTAPATPPSSPHEPDQTGAPVIAMPDSRPSRFSVILDAFPEAGAVLVHVSAKVVARSLRVVREIAREYRSSDLVAVFKSVNHKTVDNLGSKIDVAILIFGIQGLGLVGRQWASAGVPQQFQALPRCNGNSLPFIAEWK